MNKPFFCPSPLKRHVMLMVLSMAPIALHAADDAVNAEASDLGQALERIDQSFTYHGLRSGHGSASVGGAQFRDRVQRRHKSATVPAQDWTFKLPPGQQ